MARFSTVTFTVRNTLNQPVTFDFMNGMGFGTTPLLSNRTRYGIAAITATSVNWGTCIRLDVNMNYRTYYSVGNSTGAFTSIYDAVVYWNQVMPICFWGVTDTGVLFAAPYNPTDIVAAVQVIAQ